MLTFQPWKIILVGFVCLLGLVYAAPNAMDRGFGDDFPSWVPGKQVSLGLDLQGGSHLLLEVEVAVVIEERLEAIVDETRRALRQAGIGYLRLGVRDGAARFRVREAADRERAVEVVSNLPSASSGFGGATGSFGGVPGGSFGSPTAVEVDDAGEVSISLTESAASEARTAALQQSIEIVRRRIDETGVREPTIQRQGEDRILVQLPGVDDPDRIKELLGQTAKLTFHEVDTAASVQQALAGRVPPGRRLVPAANAGAGEQTHYIIHRRVTVSGDRLVDSQPTFDQNRPVVSFRFDATGGRLFGRFTSEHVNEPFAILLDGEVISAPVIQQPILGGSGIITGRFTVQEVQDLSLLLRAGALPAPLVVLEERTVGPGLGADSIEAGKIAALVGVIGVAIFMVVSYGLFGLMANAALMFNIVLIVGALSALQATLTLPGIAGIVLTVGMAVDANVLIFERIREEILQGRTPSTAIDAGYKRAITTIIDSNLTTLFAATFLYSFGSGPIKGFAVTLAIGIVTSMFTAIMVTRLMVVLWLRRSRPAALPI